MSRILSREFFKWEIDTAVSSEAMGSANAKGLLDHDLAQREKIERQKGLLTEIMGWGSPFPPWTWSGLLTQKLPEDHNGYASGLAKRIQAELSRED